jgi:uncharacterized Fe-S cluster-containing radical SAM superfamily protein
MLNVVHQHNLREEPTPASGLQSHETVCRPESSRLRTRQDTVMRDEKVKLLRHYDRLQGIVDREFRPPVMADIDVVNGLCNLDCEWCAQRESREGKKPSFMSVDTMKRMGPFCREWGVKAWRIGGDSEPTLNEHIHHLFRSGADQGIDMGLITNGVLLDKVRDIHLLRWIGISLDAVTAATWSRLKHAAPSTFHRIVESIRTIREKYPELNVTIKCVRWSNASHLDRYDLSSGRKDSEEESANLLDNYADAEEVPRFAEALGCSYVVRNAMPKDAAATYRFDVCRATPLYATFASDHKFYLCCDQRSNYVLTDDYTRNDWTELPSLWGSSEHKRLIDSIRPKACKYCSKEWLNTIIESIVLDGKLTRDFDVNFI